MIDAISSIVQNTKEVFNLNKTISSVFLWEIKDVDLLLMSHLRLNLYSEQHFSLCLYRIKLSMCVDECDERFPWKKKEKCWQEFKIKKRILLDQQVHRSHGRRLEHFEHELRAQCKNLTLILQPFSKRKKFIDLLSSILQSFVFPYRIFMNNTFVNFEKFFCIDFIQTKLKIEK